MSRAELFALADRAQNPAEGAGGKNYRRLASAVLEQAIKDAQNGVDIPYLKCWVHKEQVEILCAISELDVEYYRKQLQGLLEKKEARA